MQRILFSNTIIFNDLIEDLAFKTIFYETMLFCKLDCEITLQSVTGINQYLAIRIISDGRLSIICINEIACIMPGGIHVQFSN